MNKDRLTFLKKLLSACGPSGFETAPAQVYRERVESCAQSVETDVLGNTIAVLNPKSSFRVMIAGHVDEIGYQVTALSPDGLVYIRTVGGINKQTAPGTPVYIMTQKGYVNAFIAVKPLHFIEPADRDRAPDIKNLWLETGAENLKDLEAMGIAVGDPVATRPNVECVGKNRIVSKGMDDKIGAFIAAEVFRKLAAEKKRLKVGVYAVGTVQEEIGLRGATVAAHRINPNVGFCIDVGFTSDTPDIDRKILGDCALGKGPIFVRNADNNPVLAARLRAAADDLKLPYQISAGRLSTGGNDTAIIQMTRDGVATALFSMPSRYMHSPVETVDLRDVEAAIDIMAETILRMTDKDQFRPGIDHA